MNTCTASHHVADMSRFCFQPKEGANLGFYVDPDCKINSTSTEDFSTVYGFDGDQVLVTKYDQLGRVEEQHVADLFPSILACPRNQDGVKITVAEKSQFKANSLEYPDAVAVMVTHWARTKDLTEDLDKALDSHAFADQVLALCRPEVQHEATSQLDQVLDNWDLVVKGMQAMEMTKQ